MKRILLIALAGLLLAGCATPIGQRKPSELHWKEKIIAAKYDEVYMRISDGFRKWGGAVVEGTLYADKKAGHFDVYMKDIFGGRSSVCIATIDITQVAGGNSKITIGSLAGKNEAYNGDWWIKFAEGDYSFLDSQ